MGKLFEELKRRKVFRMAAAFAAWEKAVAIQKKLYGAFSRN